jgi:hypothetical protein
VSTPLRRALERRSLPVLAYLRALPNWLPLTVTVLLVLGGVFAPPLVGAALLAVIALLITWITYLAWPALPPGGRLGRLGALILVLVAMVIRAAGG